jgi:nucleoside-diphosphate-sugar epimerase
MAFSKRIPGVRTPVDRDFIEMATSRKAFPVAKARERLGWEPTVGLGEGMERTVAWLRQAGIRS